MKLKLIVFAVMAAPALFWNCLSNPFGGDNQIKDKRQASGQVVYEEGAAAGGVFGWLDIYDISFTTNAEGEFTVVLPAAQSRQGIVEEGILYFYLANYQLATARVKISQGEFMPLEGDLNNNGNLRNPVVMRTSVNIITEVLPPVLPDEAVDSLFVRVTLAAQQGCVTIFNPLLAAPPTQGAKGPLGAAILRHLDSQALFILRSAPDGRASERVIPCVDEPEIREMVQPKSQLPALPVGRYEVIPYLLLEPANAPSGLLQKIGGEVNELGQNYLKKPMRRQGGTFEIKG